MTKLILILLTLFGTLFCFEESSDGLFIIEILANQSQYKHDGYDFSKLQSCTSNADCEMDSVCLKGLRGKCSCKFGSVFNPPLKSCIQINCTNDFDCDRRFENSVCNSVNQQCQCKSYYSRSTRSMFCKANLIWFIDNENLKPVAMIASLCIVGIFVFFIIFVVLFKSYTRPKPETQPQVEVAMSNLQNEQQQSALYPKLV